MKPFARCSIAALSALATACTSPRSESPEAVSSHPDSSYGTTLTRTLEPATCGDISNLHTLGGVFLAGQPSADHFEQARAGGVKTVINLRLDSEQPGFDEAAVVSALGLAYVHLPWNGATQLTDEVFARSRELLRTAERPILLHCASANRVGALWIPWRVLDGGIPLDDAVAEAKKIGLKTADYEAKARDYVARNPR